MKKEYFEILLEEIKHNFQLAFEGLSGVNQRLDRLEAGQYELQDDVKDIKRSMGILLPIARDHEARLQALEETIRSR